MSPKQDLAYWTGQAERVTETRNPLSLPYHVAIEEAATCAAFVDSHWETTAARPGLETVKARLPRSTANDIRTLIEAVQQTQTKLLLLVDPAAADHGERARFLVDELESAIEFTLDDGVEEPADQQLEQLKAFHSQDSQRSTGLAQSLSDHGTLARSLEERILAADGSFDPALIDEALKLAATLRDDASRPVAQESAEITATRTLRNRLLTLLVERVGAVRAASRHVYRRHPQELRQVTSAHERRRRASARRATRKTEPTG